MVCFDDKTFSNSPTIGGLIGTLLASVKDLRTIFLILIRQD